MSSEFADDVVAILADGVRYERGGVVARARECFEQVTEFAHVDAAAAAEAWWRLANLRRLHSEWDLALEAARTSAAMARELGLVDIEADALNIEGAVWSTRGDYDQARVLFERMLSITRNPSIRGKALQNLGGMAAEEGRFDEGERLFARSREAYREAGDVRGEAVSVLNVGRLQLERGYPEVARATLESAVQAARASSDLEMYAAGLLNLGMALNALGLTSEAEEKITTAYGQFTIADIPVQRVRCLMQLASLASSRGEFGAARVCLDHASDVAATSGLPREQRMIAGQLKALPEG